MKLESIKINKSYIFDKEDGSWYNKNHNLMSGDIKIINEIMPKLKQIEDILNTKKVEK